MPMLLASMTISPRLGIGSVLPLAGDRPSVCESAVWLYIVRQHTRQPLSTAVFAHLSLSFFPAVFLRLGVGILHSIEKATQFVHGTPKLAASHRT